MYRRYYTPLVTGTSNMVHIRATLQALDPVQREISYHTPSRLMVWTTHVKMILAKESVAYYQPTPAASFLE